MGEANGWGRPSRKDQTLEIKNWQTLGGKPKLIWKKRRVTVESFRAWKDDQPLNRDDSHLERGAWAENQNFHEAEIASRKISEVLRSINSFRERKQRFKVLSWQPPESSTWQRKQSWKIWISHRRPEPKNRGNQLSKWDLVANCDQVTA